MDFTCVDVSVVVCGSDMWPCRAPVQVCATRCGATLRRWPQLASKGTIKFTRFSRFSWSSSFAPNSMTACPPRLLVSSAASGGPVDEQDFVSGDISVRTSGLTPSMVTAAGETQAPMRLCKHHAAFSTRHAARCPSGFKSSRTCCIRGATHMSTRAVG